MAARDGSTVACAIATALAIVAASATAEGASPAGRSHDAAAAPRSSSAVLPTGVLWEPLVQRPRATLRYTRTRRPPTQVLRLADARRAGYVAVAARISSSVAVTARARLNLARQRLRAGNARALVAVGARGGTAYQAGVLRRRSGRLAWAVWVKRPDGRLVGLRAGGSAETRRWHRVELRTRWSAGAARAVLRVDGATVARTPARDLATHLAERVTLGLGRPPSADQTGVLLLRAVRVVTVGRGAAGPTPAPGAGAPGQPAGDPPPDGVFRLLPRGAALPSGQHCAARVLRSTWEPRPGNYAANHRTPGALDLVAQPEFDARWNSSYLHRVSGRFVGTTDEILQWVACKWGLDVDLLRAQTVAESFWNQDQLGDFEARSEGHCTPDDTGDPCPTSFGLLQNKWYYNLGAYPMIRTMTSFGADWAGAKMRGCFDGHKGFPAGDMWGCIGNWWSGMWKDSGADAYVERVSAQLEDRAWTRWEDLGHTVPYSTGLVG
jgi:autotransporter family porin